MLANIGSVASANRQDKYSKIPIEMKCKLLTGIVGRAFADLFGDFSYMLVLLRDRKPRFRGLATLYIM
jgi:hypothetical protein